MRLTLTSMVPAVVFFMSSLAIGQEVSPLPLMPWPASVKTTRANGQMVVDASFTVGLEKHADARLHKTVAIFLDDLRRHTGMLPLDFGVTAPETSRLAVHCE